VCYSVVVTTTSDETHRRALFGSSSSGGSSHRFLGDTTESTSSISDEVYKRLSSDVNYTKLESKVLAAFSDIGHTLGVDAPAECCHDFVKFYCADPEDSASDHRLLGATATYESCHDYAPHDSSHETSLFRLRDDLEPEFLAACFACIVFFTMILEWVISSVEEYLVKIKGVYHLVFAKILNEIMILGVISFGVFMAEESFGLKSNHVEAYHALEWCHILIFFLALLYAFQSAWILLVGELFLRFVDKCVAKPPKMLQDEARGKRRRSLQTYSHELRMTDMTSETQEALKREKRAMAEVLQNAGAHIRDADPRFSPKSRVSRVLNVARKSYQTQPRSPVARVGSNALPSHALQRVIMEGGTLGTINITMGSSQLTHDKKLERAEDEAALWDFLASENLTHSFQVSTARRRHLHVKLTSLVALNVLNVASRGDGALRHLLVEKNPTTYWKLPTSNAVPRGTSTQTVRRRTPSVLSNLKSGLFCTLQELFCGRSTQLKFEMQFHALRHHFLQHFFHDKKVRSEVDFVFYIETGVANKMMETLDINKVTWTFVIGCGLPLMLQVPIVPSTRITLSPPHRCCRCTATSAAPLLIQHSPCCYSLLQKFIADKETFMLIFMVAGIVLLLLSVLVVVGLWLTMTTALRRQTHGDPFQLEHLASVMATVEFMYPLQGMFRDKAGPSAIGRHVHRMESEGPKGESSTRMTITDVITHGLSSAVSGRASFVGDAKTQGTKNEHFGEKTTVQEAMEQIRNKSVTDPGSERGTRLIVARIHGK
jgi:hypothetical protein